MGSNATNYYKSSDPDAIAFAAPSPMSPGRAATEEMQAQKNYLANTASGNIHSASYRDAASKYGPSGTSPVTTGSTPPSPGNNPTTLYSGNVDSKYVPDQNDRMNNLSQTGAYNDPAGSSYYPNGDVMDTSVSDSDLQNDPTYQLIDSYRKKTDATTDAYISSIQDQYKNSLIPEQEEANRAEAGGVQNLLFKYGANKTGSGTHAMGAVATHGLQAIAKLQSDENTAIAQARQSQSDGDFKSAEDQIGIAENIRKDKQVQAKAIYDDMSQKQEQTQKDISAVMKTAAENGAPEDVINQIAAAKDVAGAYVAAGNFSMNSSSAEGKAYNYAKNSGYSGSPLDFHREWEAAGRKPDTGGTGVSGYNGDYAGTIARAANKMASVSGSASMKEDLQSAIAANDWATAAGLIVDASTSGLTAENKTKVQNANVDTVMLSNLRDSLQKLSDKGYNTNLFTGSADEIQKKIGILQQDPTYTALAAELDRNFQQYRQNMTGAAFGPAESAEYAKVNPSKSNTLKLNLALIDGALNYSKNYVQGVVKSSTGDGGVDILERGTGLSPEQKIIKADDTAKNAVADWVSSSPENEDRYNEVRAIFPDATPTELMEQLGL